MRSLADLTFYFLSSPTEEDMMAIDEKCVEAGNSSPVSYCFLHLSLLLCE